MLEADALSALAALANPTRLSTYRLIVRHEPDGLTTGALVEANAQELCRDLKRHRLKQAVQIIIPDPHHPPL